MNDENKYNEYKNKKLTVALTVSFDMGWSKRSSGNIYDSISGHTLKIGDVSDRILTAALSSKVCITCSKAEILVKSQPITSAVKIMKGPPKRWRQMLPFTSTSVYLLITTKKIF